MDQCEESMFCWHISDDGYVLRHNESLLIDRSDQNWDPHKILLGMASADDVAELGLARLPYGPTCNWGSGDDEPGMAPTSLSNRSARILAVEEASKAYARKT